MHRALRLPEIVAAIMHAGMGEAGLLYHSLFVNRLFFLEASRILWSECGDLTTLEHPAPHIGRLGRMALLDHIGLERAQTYANLVQRLSFHYEIDDEGEQHDANSWHSVLKQLQFPRLEYLELQETDQAASLITEEVILHYAQPNLRTLNVVVCGSLSDHFFESLTERCLKLQELNLSRPDEVTASTYSVARMFKKMTSLRRLDLGEEFCHIFSADLLGAIAFYPKLETLTIPRIPEACLLSLGQHPTHAPFPQLQYLYLSATAPFLELLLSYVPGLDTRVTDLWLSNERLLQSNGILAAASRFGGLTSITVQLNASSNIRGDELLQLAENCSDLMDLRLGIDGWSEIMPTATGITDELMEKLAIKLPKLQELIFLLNTDTQPGAVATLKTLARHCSSLRSLTFPCRADWELLTTLPKDAPITRSLENVHFRPSSHMEQSLSKEEQVSVLEVWQAHASVWFPHTDFMTIKDADALEQDFEKVLWNDKDILGDHDDEEELEEDVVE